MKLPFPKLSHCLLKHLTTIDTKTWPINAPFPTHNKSREMHSLSQRTISSRIVLERCIPHGVLCRLCFRINIPDFLDLNSEKHKTFLSIIIELVLAHCPQEIDIRQKIMNYHSKISPRALCFFIQKKNTGCFFV